jgi:hypothetical protein
MMKLESQAVKSDLVFGVLFTLIFIVGGLGHFGQFEDMRLRFQQSPWLSLSSAIGSPSMLLHFSRAAWLVGGVALSINYRTRTAALLLLVTSLRLGCVQPRHAVRMKDQRMGFRSRRPDDWHRASTQMRRT